MTGKYAERLSHIEGVSALDRESFEVTLDEPFLLGGGFLSQGCAGALLMAIAACIPSNRRSAPEEATPVEDAPPEPAIAPDPVEPDAVSGPPLLLPAPQEEPAPPDTAPEDAFIALLPGEEPLVVDTALDDAEGEPPETATLSEEDSSEDKDAGIQENAPPP